MLYFLKLDFDIHDFCSNDKCLKERTWEKIISFPSKFEFTEMAYLWIYFFCVDIKIQDRLGCVLVHMCVLFFLRLKRDVLFLSLFIFPIAIKNENKKLQLSRIFLNWLLSNMNHNFVFKYLSVFSGTLIKHNSLLRLIIIGPAGRK